MLPSTKGQQGAIHHKQPQQATTLPRLSSCTIPLHLLPVAALPVRVLPATVLPVVHWPALQNSQTATPALPVKVFPLMFRPMLGPRLFCVFSPANPLFSKTLPDITSPANSLPCQGLLSNRLCSNFEWLLLICYGSHRAHFGST